MDKLAQKIKLYALDKLILWYYITYNIVLHADENILKQFNILRLNYTLRFQCINNYIESISQKIKEF